MAGGIFISYRREDSGGSARGIYDRLKQTLGLNHVFIDVMNINLGLDWKATLENAIGRCEVLLAIIGREWACCTDELKQFRLRDPNDYVRIEIETALARQIPVIPVLVERATMPRGDELPDALQQLPRRQGMTVTVERFDTDVDLLSSELSKILKRRAEDATWATIVEKDSKNKFPRNEEELIKIISLLGDTFTYHELSDLVLFNLGQDIHDEILLNTSSPGNIGGIVAGLLARGVLSHFLPAIGRAKPDAGALLSAIAPNHPIACGSPDVEAVNAVRHGLQVLYELRADPSAPLAAAIRIGESQQKLTGLADDLEKLRAYKVLHDTLQKIQIDHYGQVKQQIGKLRQDPAIAEEIGAHIDSMRILAQDAAGGAAALSEVPSRYNPERRWISSFNSAVDNLERALQSFDDMPARSSVLTIRSIIRTNPVRVNQALREAAENLPLRDLVSIFKEVAPIPELSRQQRYILNTAKTTLDFLHTNLQARVALHNQWQEVETELWGADDEFEQPQLCAFSDDLRLYWYNIQKKIKPLWDIDPSLPWVRNTRQYANTLDLLLNSSGDEFIKARYNYGRFKVHARTQFYAVDGALKDFSGKILRIGQPLNEVISGGARC